MEVDAREVSVWLVEWLYYTTRTPAVQLVASCNQLGHSGYSVEVMIVRPARLPEKGSIMNATMTSSDLRVQLVGRPEGQQVVVSQGGRHYLVPFGELAKSDSVELDDSRLAFQPVDPQDEIVRPDELPDSLLQAIAALRQDGILVFDDSRKLSDSIFMHFCKRVKFRVSDPAVSFGAVARTATDHARANGHKVAIGEYEWDELLAAAWHRLKEHFAPPAADA